MSYSVHNFKEKSILLLMVIPLFLLVSCSSECDEVLVIPTLASTEIYDQNINDIQNYLASNGLTASSTNSGLHYIVSNAGEALKPTLCDNVNVTYSGYLLDGTEFDAGTISFNLTGVIRGWQEGIPLYGKGGSGTLLIPSYLAYGNNPPDGSVIRANDVLIFDITLNGF